MKKKLIFLSIFLIFTFVSIFMVMNINKKEISFHESIIKKDENLLSMMLEQTAGVGDYQMTTASKWPTEGYTFNSELSKCENGSKVIWNDTKKTVTYQGNLTDKCFVYFDVVPPTKVSDVCSGGENLAGCIKKLSDKGGASNTNIYYHDSNLTNGAGDNSYRYAGANPNNYVCFGSTDSTCPTDNLYRIIGVFEDQVKLIKSTKATSALLGTDGDYYSDTAYYWNYNADTSINDGNGSNTWSTSLLNKINLNTNFINNIGSTWASKISETTWKVGGNTSANILSQIPLVAYQNEIVNPVTTNTTDNATTFGPSASSKIGLMYVSDYGFAADPNTWTITLNNYYDRVNGLIKSSLNWMYSGLYEWTISRCADSSSLAFSATYMIQLFVGTFGYVDNSSVVVTKNAVRPTFYLNSSVTYVSGEGSSITPFRIE